MSFTDVIGIVSFVLGLIAFLETKFSRSIGSWISRWWREKKFSDLKQELLKTRRRIALLKRSRLPGKRSEDFVLVIAFALAFLGIVISALSLALSNHELIQKLFPQSQMFLFVFMGGVTIFAIVMFGPNISSPKHYRFVLQKLELKRKNLVKKVQDAETQ